MTYIYTIYYYIKQGDILHQDSNSSLQAEGKERKGQKIFRVRDFLQPWDDFAGF